jgi:hypothetical protein
LADSVKSREQDAVTSEVDEVDWAMVLAVIGI